MPKRRSKGDGSLYFDEKRGLYVGQITLGVDEKGKRKRKTVYGSTKAEVKQKLKNIEFGVYTGTFTDKSSITVYHLAMQLLDDKLRQNEIKNSTYLRHIETLKQLKEIYNTPLQEANETLLRQFLSNNINYSDSVLKKMYELLNQTFKEALRRKIISENPMAFIKKPHSKQKALPVRALTKDEQRKLIEILKTKNINYSRQMLLSLAIGLRMGEINALDISDVDFKSGTLTVRRTISRGEKGAAVLSDTPKTDAGLRTLAMTNDVQMLLIDAIDGRDEGIIFTHKEKLISTSQVNSQFKRILEKYDIIDKTITNAKVDLHSLRHTFATRCAEAGMPPKVLQEIMGHSDITITMNTYFSASDDYIKENVMKIDNILKNEGLNIGNL